MQPPDRGLDRDQPDERVELGQDRLGRLGDDHGRRARSTGVASVAASVVAAVPVPAVPGVAGAAGPADEPAPPAASAPPGPSRFARSRTAAFASATSSIVASAASASAVTVGVAQAFPAGSRNALQVAIGTSAGAVVTEDADQTPEHVPELDRGVRVRLGDRDRLVAHPVADHSDGSV